MSCCGDKRALYRQEPLPSGAADASHPWSAGSMDLVYVGQGQLTVTGPLTGTRYRFIGYGARVRIHGSDLPSLVLVPGLKPA
jgi:hypothetical protein